MTDAMGHGPSLERITSILGFVMGAITLWLPSGNRSSATWLLDFVTGNGQAVAGVVFLIGSLGYFAAACFAVGRFRAFAMLGGLAIQFFVLLTLSISLGVLAFFEGSAPYARGAVAYFWVAATVSVAVYVGIDRVRVGRFHGW